VSWRGYDPDADPAVKAAYDTYSAAISEHNAYLFASGKTLHPWERAEVLAEGGSFVTDPWYEAGAERWLYEADKAYYEAWHAANRRAHPELYRDGLGPHFRHPDQWREMYPNAAPASTPCQYGITDDPDATWGDFYIGKDGTVTRLFVEADPSLEAAFAAPDAEVSTDRDDATMLQEMTGDLERAGTTIDSITGRQAEHRAGWQADRQHWPTRPGQDQATEREQDPETGWDDPEIGALAGIMTRPETSHPSPTPRTAGQGEHPVHPEQAGRHDGPGTGAEERAPLVVVCRGRRNSAGGAGSRGSCPRRSRVPGRVTRPGCGQLPGTVLTGKPDDQLGESCAAPRPGVGPESRCPSTPTTQRRQPADCTATPNQQIRRTCTMAPSSQVQAGGRVADVLQGTMTSATSPGHVEFAEPGG
jgi:hypothetical protein